MLHPVMQSPPPVNLSITVKGSGPIRAVRPRTRAFLASVAIMDSFNEHNDTLLTKGRNFNFFEVGTFLYQTVQLSLLYTVSNIRT